MCQWRNGNETASATQRQKPVVANASPFHLEFYDDEYQDYKSFRSNDFDNRS